jgi:hypothetical protein
MSQINESLRSQIQDVFLSGSFKGSFDKKNSKWLKGVGFKIIF